MISPTFIEANYEVIESLLRERRRHMRNEDLCTELEYFSEKYDEEMEIKPRPTRAREATPVLQAASLRIRRQKERVVEFEDASNREVSRVKRNDEGGRPPRQRTKENRPQEMNLPSLIAAHLGRRKNGQPLQTSLTFVHGGHHPSTNIGGNLLLNDPLDHEDGAVSGSHRLCSMGSNLEWTRERKAKSTLLMAIPDEHLARFHGIKDAKTLWAAIKTRFGGVSTEDANKKFLRSLPLAWSNISLILRNKLGIDNLDIDDLYNNLKVYEADIKGSSGSSSNLHNVAFVSEESTSNTNKLNAAYSVSTATGHCS
nr:ribonuclease H-like domain-containing protein [Tanacetum cinerariifolium]